MPLFFTLLILSGGVWSSSDVGISETLSSMVERGELAAARDYYTEHVSSMMKSKATKDQVSDFAETSLLFVNLVERRTQASLDTDRDAVIGEVAKYALKILQRAISKCGHSPTFHSYAMYWRRVSGDLCLALIERGFDGDGKYAAVAMENYGTVDRSEGLRGFKYTFPDIIRVHIGLARLLFMQGQEAKGGASLLALRNKVQVQVRAIREAPDGQEEATLERISLVEELLQDIEGRFTDQVDKALFDSWVTGDDDDVEYSTVRSPVESTETTITDGTGVETQGRVPDEEEYVDDDGFVFVKSNFVT